ncbi:MFS transporter [Nocardioides terrisoli]|uniref:MFS transporter n=1 Tax=Nocardioides terrisoli TaxID=3388267 RepID=UPI00287B8908|nr:MFS transporter [Nocardioides marmorisolisilvae]
MTEQVTTTPWVGPDRPVSRGWTTRFTLVWFGIWMAWLVPIQLVLPDQLDRIDHAHRISDFGWINGGVGVVAIVTLPLFGALCDRTSSRLGRRRVWVLGGVVVFVLGLLLSGLQTDWVALGGCWVLASLGNNAMAAGLTAVIADEVPESQRGMASAAIYGPQAVGILVGLLAVQGLGTMGRFVALALGLLVFSLPFLLGHRDAPPAATAPPLSVRSVARGMWISPRDHPDFAWAFGGRLLVNLGNAFGTTELLFFLRDDLKVPDPDSRLVQLTLVYLVFTVLATYLGGIWSDRTGRRRVFVAVASCLQAVAALLLAALPSWDTAMVGAALLGAGYGAFMSVDQALITAVLPSAEDRAKDLGLMNIGSVLPQALGPLLGGLFITTLGGYPMLFGAAGVITLAGAAMVYRIRSVR